jgi:hypothetical protein
MQPEERAMKVLATFDGCPVCVPVTVARDVIAAAIREAVAAEQQAVLRSLRVLRDEHSPTHEWARGVKGAIACVEARVGKPAG